MEISGINFNSEIPGQGSNVSGVQANTVKGSVFTAGKQGATTQDVREKVDVDKKVKDFIKEHKMKKLKQPGGDSGTMVYTSDDYDMMVKEDKLGKKTVTLMEHSADRKATTTYYYDEDGHLVKEATAGLNGSSIVTEYLPDGTTRLSEE